MTENMFKKTITILTVVILLTTMFVGLIPATTALTYPTHLEATGTCSGANCEDRIEIPLAGQTLGDLDTLEWQVELLGGYIPHIDIGLDYNGDGIKDDALVIEGAYVNNNINNNTWSTGTWLNTFEGASGTFVSWCIDCVGTAPTTIINDSSPAWLDSLGQWPTIYTVAGWKSGLGASKVNSSTPVTNIEIEVDNWLRDDLAWGVYTANAEANIRDIRINGILIPETPIPPPPIPGGPPWVERTWEWGNLTLDIFNGKITNTPYGASVFATYTITNTAYQGLMQMYYFDIVDSNGNVVTSTNNAGFWLNKGASRTINLYWGFNTLSSGEYTIRLNVEIQNVFPVTPIGDNTRFSESTETIIV